jgi:hypothetical protein
MGDADAASDAFAAGERVALAASNGCPCRAEPADGPGKRATRTGMAVAHEPAG